MIKIHDIKPLVTIPDYTIYIYYGLIISSILLILFVLFWLYKSLSKKTSSKNKEYLQILKNIDFSNPKQDSYTISKYGRLLATNERDKRLLDELHQSLEEFKYKRNISNNFTEKIKMQFDIFMESLDVK